MQNENLKSLIFATIISVAAAAILSGAVVTFKPKQEQNIRLDIKKNILKSLAIEFPSDPHEIEAVYDQNIREQVVNTQGVIQDNLKPSQIKEGQKDLLPLYLSVQNDKVLAYCIPVSGKGLWSTILGYMALEADLNTVKGITFYKHGETPGLGAEIEKPWFQDNYKGKKILNAQGELVSVMIVKGKVNPGDSQKDHHVDGISGATMTGKGVNAFLLQNLKAYENYFKKVRSNG